MEVTAVVGVAMIAAAAGSLGCALASGARQPGAVVAGVVMLLAMSDMALGHVLLVPVAWAAVLLALGVFVVTLPADANLCGWRHGLALVAAAVIMFGSPHALPVASAAGHAGHAVAGAASGAVGVVVVLAYAVAALAGTTGRRADVTEVLLTTVCLALMAAVPFLA